MAKNYASLAFTDEVKKIQEKMGSRATYARLEKNTYVDGLTQNEVSYIAGMDSFYLATIGENGFPYIKYRGGPKGFVKVLDAKRIGFIDFSGNKQYISVGNIATHPNVSLIMVDYPTRSRLKILAKVEIINIKEAPDLYNTLDLDGYPFKPERMMVFHIEAYDWNCHQHITPKYTLEDIQDAFASQHEYITKLETEIKELKASVQE